LWTPGVRLRRLRETVNEFPGRVSRSVPIPVSMSKDEPPAAHVPSDTAPHRSSMSHDPSSTPPYYDPPRESPQSAERDAAGRDAAGGDLAVIVRPARGADVPKIAALIEPLIEQHVLLRRTIGELALLLPNFFVAMIGDELAGCAALEIYSSKLAELRSLVVGPVHRGRGIGKLLVAACVERAREEGILEVMAVTASEEFFRSCGFDFTLPGQKKALFLKTRSDGEDGHLE
jgi:amino-acid N-acetyltransferase